jgi:hypothetical protein
MNRNSFDRLFPFDLTEDATQAAQAFVDWLSVWNVTSAEGEGRQSTEEERPLLVNDQCENCNIFYESTLIIDERDVEEQATVEAEVEERAYEPMMEASSKVRRIQIDDEVRTQNDDDIHAQLEDDLRTQMNDQVDHIRNLTTRNEELLIANDILYYALTRVLEKTRTLDLTVRLHAERINDTEWIESLAEDAKATYKQELKVLVNGEENRGEESVDPLGSSKTVSP